MSTTKWPTTDTSALRAPHHGDTLPSVEALSTEWLAAVLRAVHAIFSDVHVIEYTITNASRLEDTYSQLYRIALTYDGPPKTITLQRSSSSAWPAP